MRNARFFGCSLLLILSVGVRPAEACSCSSPISICRATWTNTDTFVGNVTNFDATAVFVGQVTAIEDAPNPPGLIVNGSDRRRVHLRVGERFIGLQPTESEVDVYTGLGGGDCGYPFAIGETYFVFAYKLQDGRLGTERCTVTKPVLKAAGELGYMRRIQSNVATRATIFGTATFLNNEQSGATRRSPYAGAAITARGTTGTFTGVTKADGSYEIGVPLGDYQLSAGVESGRYASPFFWHVVFTDVRGCGESNVTVGFDGRISGRVVDSFGMPIPNLTIDVVPPTPVKDKSYKPNQSTTDADGRFMVNRLPPGPYLVGTNTRSRLLYPRVMFARATSQADVIRVGAGEQVQIGDFVIPARPEVVQIRGVVRRPDGEPVAGTRVWLYSNDDKLEEAELIGRTIVDSEGAFSFAAFEGYNYRIVPELESLTQPMSLENWIRANWRTVTAARDAGPVVLILKGGK
jgi:hypothetical protein